MNKITREHYPVSKLPEELQKEFEGFETVTLVSDETEGLTGSAAIAALGQTYATHMARLKEKGPVDYSKHRGKTTISEAIARVRGIRDGWDD